MNVLITLTSPGADTGPFNIYTNVDNYVTAVATNVAKANLVSGYNVTVPANAVTVKVESTGTCTSSIYLTIIQPTTTTTTSSSTSTTSTTSTSTSTTTSTTTLGPGTTTTTTTAGPTTTTTTTPAPNYKFYLQVRDQTDSNYGNGTFYLNATGGYNTFTTDYSLVLSGVSSFNPSGSSIVAAGGYVIDRITKYAYDGVTVLYNLPLGTGNYTFGTGPFTMNSIGVSAGQFETIKVFTRPA